jgi:endonuclease G
MLQRLQLLLSVMLSLTVLTACDLFVSDFPPCVERDCNCRDFRTQAEAQAVFNSFEGDPFDLDRDGNGQVCESLPAGDVVAFDPPNSHLGLGNPSEANQTDFNNYLIEKPQYALSYNCAKGTANWASWQLSQEGLGLTDRQDDFRPDPGTPASCYVVSPYDYRGTGYDRGHLVPSADRTRSVADNSATFVMTNIIPQSPANNREVWRELEEYSRELVDRGKKLYIVAGGEGNQGKITENRVTIPEVTWKVILAVEAGQPVTENTQTIAVIIPNDQSVEYTDWQDYQVSVDQVETLTGYNFFSELPDEIEKEVEK